jgi:PKD domain
VLLNWSPFDESHGGSELIDTTPGTPLGRTDAALVVGRTFSDRQAGVHITPLTRGATGTNIWMDVQVNLGAFSDNQPPELQVEVLPTNAAPSTLVHFHATASDPDGDTLAYAWTFDDGTFSTNNLPWAFKSFPAGEHVVRCVVSDMKGGAPAPTRS